MSYPVFDTTGEPLKSSRDISGTTFICSILCPVALLVFLAAATGAGVVAPDLRHSGSASRRCCCCASTALVAVLARRLRRLWLLGAVAFGLAGGPGDIVAVGANVARHLALRLRALQRDRHLVAQEFEQRIDGIVLDSQLQLIEHAEGFVLELD